MGDVCVCVPLCARLVVDVEGNKVRDGTATVHRSHTQQAWFAQSSIHQTISHCQWLSSVTTWLHFTESH